jgi:PAS domain S-box-containing protein
MATLPTLPRRTWLEQLSLGLAVVLILVGALALAGWWLHVDALVRPLAEIAPAPIKANAALCWLLLGLALLTVELGLPQFAWVAALPASIGLLSLIEHLVGVDLRIDELLTTDHLLFETAHPGRMDAVTAGCIFLGGAVVAWRTFAPGARARIFAGALAGSIIGAVGLATLLGYATSLPVVYRWGTGTAASLVCGLALLILGCALLLGAWREGSQAENGPPSWSPMPAVIICLALTSVLWIGLRARELDYLGANTQTTINSLAIAIDRELKQLSTDVDDRLAAPWSRVAEDSAALWEVYGALFFSAVKDNGGTAVAWVDPRPDLSLRTRWIYPVKGNEGAISFDHLLDKGRAETIGAAQLSDHSVVSGTIVMPNGKGFVIYTAVRRQGAIAGYVAAEFSYAGFFGAIDRQLNLSQNYYAAIAMDGEPVYATLLADESRDNGQSYSVVIQRHRFRLNLAPTAEYLRNNRRFLPELALFAGLGITGLLGLSAFLARRARAGQLAAEESNRRLLAENEKRSRVEARLQTSDERLRLTLDSTGIGIFEWNVALGYVYYSPGLWAMLGYDHGRMPATVEALQSLIHPEDLPVYRRRTEAQLSGGTSFIEPEFRVRSRTGEWRWVYVRAKSVATTAAGLPTRILGTMQDITARREAEEALRASQASTRKLSLVASRTDNLVIIFTADGRVEWANESFTRTMEYPLPEIVGKLSTELLAGPETDPRAIARLRTALAHGQGLSTDLVQYAKSGRKYHLAFEIQPVRNQAGEVENFIAVASDITARVETEQALRRAKLEADTASRAKSEFLASMSHEIRTPMNGVIGMTSLLLETNLSVEQREYVNTIRSSGEALLTIINDILDFSKIESGKLELERLPFELSVCLEETLDLFAPQAAEKRIELVYGVDRSVPPLVLGDITRLRQVLVNLVNNAVKFTPGGSIAVEVRKAPGDPAEHGVPPGHLLLEFTVRDTGIGIPADSVDRLFKAFSQVDSSTTRKYGGTGLGLAICQRLCALMGGDIRVESTEGQGSSFIFTMQTEPAAIPLENSLPPLPGLLQHGTVLVVEEHPVAQRRLQELFAAWGASSLVASDAAHAGELASGLAAPPVLLVVDFDPAEPGASFDALAAIKAPRLVMLPFGQNPPEIPRDGPLYNFIAKPIKNSLFYHAVSTLLASVAKAGTPLPSEPVHRLSDEIPLDVLLVEDNPVNQKVALRFLDRLGYRADAAGNGLEAVNTLESRHYHLVLMDLQMPEMDGLEASRQIRRRLPPERQPKIIALTANALHGDRELCIAAGMDDYISKPVKLHEIEEAIRRQFGPPPDPVKTIG